MTLEDAIKYCEEVMMENLEKTKDKNASDPIAISCGECADNHRQLAEWLRELKRADTLLKATYDLLNKQYGNIYVLNLLAETVYYDGAECDGNCLMEDIDTWMDERGIDHDETGN